MTRRMRRPATAHDDEALGKAYDARLMRRLLGFMRPHRVAIGWTVVAIIGLSVLQLAPPYLTKVAIDAHITTGELAGLDTRAFLFLGVLVLSYVLEYVHTYTLQVTGQRIIFDLRMRIQEHLQRLDVAFYDRNPVGRLMTRVTTDVDALNDLFASGVVSAFRDIFMLGGIAIVLVVMDWRLAIVALSVLPLIALVTQWFRRNARHSYRQVRGWIARINAFLQENITGMATVQLFRREALHFDRFDAINQGHRDANIASIFYYAGVYPAIEVLGALAIAAIVWFGGGWTLQGTLELGSLVAFVLYSQRFFRPISDLSEKFNLLQAAMASSERIFALLDTPVSIESPTSRTPSDCHHGLPAGPGHIRFEHVWFAYRDDEYVLEDVTFDVAPGQRVGVVGATGAGKTTLINLLMRFYDVNRGRITIDGVDIPVRARAAGWLSVLGHGGRQHPAWQRRHLRRRRASRGGRRPRRPVHRVASGRLRQPSGGAWCDFLGRSAPAALVRACTGAPAIGAGSRRGHLEHRYRYRAADSGRLARADVRSNHDRHRPPVVHRPGYGRHSGLPQGPAPRDRQSSGAARAAWAVFHPVPAPVPRPGSRLGRG